MIIVIAGPTGVGKTKLSIELAKEYNAIICNADSMQVYKGLNIGTSKVTEQEKENIKHYLFDIREVDEYYSIFEYQRDLRKILDDFKDKNVIIVGGTGLYIKAGLYNYTLNKDLGKKDYSKYSNDELYNMVLNIDKNTSIHKNNRVRLERFLNRDNNIDSKSNELLYDTKFIGLTTNRNNLYKRINDRVDTMINNGLVDEVKYYYDRNIKTKPLLNGIGYKELYAYFDNYVSLSEAINNIKKNSRHYAKRQYTFFNNQFDMKWFDVDFNNFDNTINEVENYINKN